MTISYKTDDSFFTTVFPPFIFHGWSVKSWLINNDSAKYRYIRDHEAEQEFWNAQQIQELYPGIKLIGFAINPWARMHYAYTQLCLMKEQSNTAIDLSQLILNDFDSFIKSLCDKNYNGNFWFSLTTPIYKWFEYTDENGQLKTVDYLLKDITIEQDFKAIQDYFISDIPISFENTISNYRQYYTDDTKNIVADIFKEDISKFGYEF